MSNLSLYRRYRPHCFQEVIGQEHIKTVLTNSIGLNKINHSYIFSGPRGIGKTSIARIFAMAINCLEPINNDCCQKCANCLDLLNDTAVDFIELDAASNNGVEQVRSIIENVYYLPSKFKKKVYVIDEAHMLSNQAWNAFLKTLEEPPAHIVFIFATTEFQKIPLTIISRSQRFDFQALNNQQLKTLLVDVLSKEKIIMSDDAQDVLINLAQSSARDMLSLLDQLNTSKEKIDLETIQAIFNLVVYDDQINFILLALQGDYVGLKDLLKKIIINGHNVQVFIYDILQMLFAYKYLVLTNDDKGSSLIQNNDVQTLKKHDQFKIDELVNLLIPLHTNLKNSIDQEFECLKALYPFVFVHKEKPQTKHNLENNQATETKVPFVSFKPKPLESPVVKTSDRAINETPNLDSTLMLEQQHVDKNLNYKNAYFADVFQTYDKSLLEIKDSLQVDQIDWFKSRENVTRPAKENDVLDRLSATEPKKAISKTKDVVSSSLKNIQEENLAMANKIVYNVYTDRQKSIDVNNSLKELKNKWNETDLSCSYSLSELKWLNLVKEIKLIAGVSEHGIICVCNKTALPKIYKVFKNIDFINFVYKNIVPKKQYVFISTSDFQGIIDEYKKQSNTEKSHIIKDIENGLWTQLYDEYERQGHEVCDLIANLEEIKD
ncbi:DNA polymerase III subunit gamma/tau [Ureaplasma miroungigenitalium]|uniref:DNA polymerase III subunit gamma/tau n=1 Tax=Ureaplasma miroungigenitalium TaxID=1042321 RepID=UPI0021E81040|nr:DNA polymerase III subunit gamma/tau [Ureaplasma miroungigenitalium]MCV3734367.1 DNA polymerase III subunit gamma/tau [Ureaplasma miroungigenitalium]